MITRFSNITLLIVLLSTIVFAQGQQEIQLTPEQQKLMRQYAKLNNQIREIQQQAMDAPEIVAQKQALDQKVIDLMLKNDPSIQSVIDERERLAAQLKSLKESGNQNSSLEEQYREVSNTLRDAQKVAFESPEIVALIEQFEKNVQNKMAEIDPNYTNLAAQLEEIKEKFSSIKPNNNTD
jgi:DNA repair exonuclease SbcCD ATPase subunit